MRSYVYACTVVISFALGGIVAFTSNPNDLISYWQQRQDKELCERDIKRSERCVPVMMWLPEAVQ